MKAVIGKRVGAAAMLRLLSDRPDVAADDFDEIEVEKLDEVAPDKTKLTDAEKLDGDRRRYETDGPGKGRVTNRLLRDLLGGVARSTVSYRLNELCNKGIISTSIAAKLTANEVQAVLLDVAKTPFRSWK